MLQTSNLKTMFKHYFERIIGIEVYPIISLLLFVLFFLGLLIWVFKADKKYIHEMSNVPLNGSNEEESLFNRKN
jgi:cytochrome c oxidase cbb3-type subunit IV